MTKVDLRAGEDDRSVRTKVADFGYPPASDALVATRAVDGETDNEDVGVWVAKRSEAVVVTRAGGVAEGELIGVAINLQCR